MHFPHRYAGRSVDVALRDRQSPGRLCYRNWEEFEEISRQIGAPTKDALGRQGRKYVTDFYSWDRVERDYLTLLPAAV